MTFWSTLLAVTALEAASLATPGPVQVALPALSLQQAIAEAQQHAPKIKKSAAAVAQQQHSKTSVKASFLPKLNVTAGYVPLFAFPTEATGKTPSDGVVALKSPLSELGAQFALNAFDGLQNVYRLRAQTLHVHAAAQAHSWEIFTLQRLVRYKYRQVQAATALKQAAVQQLTTLESHLQQLTELKSQQAATEFDLLRLQVRLENAKTELILADDNIVLSRRDLAQAMGLVDDLRPLQGALPQPQAARAQAVGAIDSRQLPPRADITAIMQLQKAQHALAQAADHFWWPKIDVVGNFNRYNNWDRSLNNQDLFKNAYSVGFRLHMNVFDGLQALSEAKVARQRDVQLAQEQQEATLRQGYAVAQAQRHYLYADSRFAAHTLNITRAQKSIELAMAGYRYGTQNSTDVLDAQNDLYAAQAEAVHAQLALEEHAAALELATGKELP